MLDFNCVAFHRLSNHVPKQADHFTVAEQRSEINHQPWEAKKSPNLVKILSSATVNFFIS